MIDQATFLRIAEEITNELGLDWGEKLQTILLTALEHPHFFISPKSTFARSYASILEGSEQEIRLLLQGKIKKYYKERSKQFKLSTVSTAHDPALDVIIQTHYGTSHQQTADLFQHHREAMSAENILGYLLEAYIADTMEHYGWIWCSGAILLSIDFILTTRPVTLLQIKNRDNSENSSSAKVREGTNIKKWHRFNSKSGQTYWNQLIDITATHATIDLNEEGFLRYIANMLSKQHS